MLLHHSKETLLLFYAKPLLTVLHNLSRKHSDTLAAIMLGMQVCSAHCHGASVAAFQRGQYQDWLTSRFVVQAPVEMASLPCTPGTGLHASALQATARSTVGRRSRSASFDTPMEGVLERPGPLLQPKTPALVHHPLRSKL